MSLLWSSIFLFLFLVLLPAPTSTQSVTSSLTIAGSIPGGSPFNVDASVVLGPNNIFFPSCYFNANASLSLSSPTLTVLPGCVIPGTSTFTSIYCNISTFDMAATTDQSFTLFSGNLIAPEACLGQVVMFSLNCTGVGPTPYVNRTSSIASSASQLSVNLFTDAPLEMLANETTLNFVIDHNQNRSSYEVNTTVANTGICPATSVVCTVTIPPLVNPANLREGLVTIKNGQFISNYTQCSLVLNVFTCLFGDVDVGNSQGFPILFDVENNGVMNITLQCNSTGLVGTAEDELTVYSINIPPPDSSSMIISSSSSDIIINVVIPLAVFGGVMFILLCAIGLTVAIYLIIKKVRAEQDVGF